MSSDTDGQGGSVTLRGGVCSDLFWNTSPEVAQSLSATFTQKVVDKKFA